MSSPATPTARRRASLSTTVLRLAAVAMIAAALVWSVLFADLVRKHANPSPALVQPSGQLPNPARSQPAQAPAPVTTRTS